MKILSISTQFNCNFSSKNQFAEQSKKCLNGSKDVLIEVKSSIFDGSKNVDADIITMAVKDLERTQEELLKMQQRGFYHSDKIAPWRSEYYEAMSKLKSIINGEPLEEEHLNPDNLMSFHDTTEDGYI